MKIKCTAFAFFLHAGLLFSTTATWVGPSPGNWNTNANWDPNTAYPNASGDVANLVDGPPPVPADPVIDLNAVITVGVMTFDLDTNYTINPMGGSFVLQVPSGNALISVTNTNGNGAHTITAPILLNSPLVVSQGSTGSFTIGPGAITGAQTLTKTGSGILVLSGSNGYTGGTIINGGTISIGADDNLGLLGTTVTVGNGALQFTATVGTPRPFLLTGATSISVAGADTATLSGVISGAGSLTKANTGTLVLSNTSNSYQGGTLVGGGVLSISSDNHLGSSSGPLTIASGTLLTTSGITSSRSGSFTGAAVIDTGGANLDIFTGNFGGVGFLTVQGGGTVQLNGVNNYSGGTTVAIGTTLQGDTHGLQGSITMNTLTSPLIFNQNFDGTYGGSLTSAVAGAGPLTKTGSGTIQFTGSSPNFSATVNVSQGTLNVNGFFANASLVTVASGATLSGAGTVGPTTNNGTLAPGNGTSIDTLTINGTLMLGANSNVHIDIAPLSSDLLAVSGTATINGSLTIEPSPGFYGFDACYTILSSSGLVLAPEFGPLLSTNSGFVPTVTYTATDAILCVEILEPFAVFPFSNSNAEAVGNNIDALFAAGELSSDLFNLFDSFAGADISSISDALDQMHPANYSSFTEFQSEAGGQLISFFHRLPYLPCSCCDSNRFWLEPFGNSLTLKRHGMQIGAQINSGGIALGYDHEFCNNLILGIGGAWNRGHLEWHDHRGHGDVDGFYGGAYADYQIGEFYIGGALLAGADFYDTSRHIQALTVDRHATADYSALDIIAQLATAYLFGAPQAFFYPYANIDFLYLHTGTFHEKGASGLNLTVQSRTDATLRTEMGLALQAQDVNADETMCISPQVSIGWVNLCPLERKLYQSTFEEATIPFKTRGWDQSWNLLNVSFGLSFAYQCFSLGLEYNVEISPDSHTTLFNQHGNVRFDWKW